jgi:hypothetical protein
MYILLKYNTKDKKMNILKDKCVACFIEKRLFLDAKGKDDNREQETLSVKARVDLDKYHTLIVISVLVYVILAFTFAR